MANSIEKMIASTFMEMAEGLETGSFGKKPKIALTGMGKKMQWKLPLLRQKRA